MNKFKNAAIGVFFMASAAMLAAQAAPAGQKDVPSHEARQVGGDGLGMCGRRSEDR